MYKTKSTTNKFIQKRCPCCCTCLIRLAHAFAVITHYRRIKAFKYVSCDCCQHLFRSSRFTFLPVLSLSCLASAYQSKLSIALGEVAHGPVVLVSVKSNSLCRLLASRMDIGDTFVNAVDDTSLLFRLSHKPQNARNRHVSQIQTRNVFSIKKSTGPTCFM